MTHPHETRLDRVREILAVRGRTLVVTSGPNLRYFTGFGGETDREIALVLAPSTDPVVLTPESYEEQVLAELDVDATVETVSSNRPESIAEGLRSTHSANEIYLDDTARFSLVHVLSSAVPDVTIEPAGEIFDPLRLRKDETEIEALRRSATMADAVSEEVRALGADAIGRTERELANRIRAGLHERGASGVSFDVVVASGPNGASPALRHEDREIRAGEPVVLDFGGFLEGYASDQTRTVVFAGEPPEGFREAHAAVLEALEAGIDAVEPGKTAGAIDTVAREVLEERGFADHVRHPTGHGIGLDAHEPPSIAEGDDTTLEPGVAFSVEPGLYFEDEFGVRVEDIVVVTETGAKRLNRSPRTWRPLDSERLDSERLDSERLDSERLDSERLDSERLDRSK